MGYIGSALAARLKADGRAVVPVGRGDALPAEPGHIYFCAGLTADFRSHRRETIEAHVTLLSQVLEAAGLRSLTYLSSTRVYLRAASGREDALIPTDPNDPSDLYNLSKLTGESLCLADERPAVRVARLSNVVGPGILSPSFIGTLIAEARQGGPVIIRSSPESVRDYVALEDALEALIRIPDRAHSRLLNVAGGRRTTNREVADLLKRHFEVEVRIEGAGDPQIFPEIAIDRMRGELGVAPMPLPDLFARLIGMPVPAPPAPGPVA
jgi:nucleoside-diphosphate-sugar epimerase